MHINNALIKEFKNSKYLTKREERTCPPTHKKKGYLLENVIHEDQSDKYPINRI